MRLTLVALIVISTSSLVGTGATIGIVDYFAGDLPSINAIQTSNLIQTTRILDRNGDLIETLYHGNRTVVPLSKISLKLQRATIDTEDRTFYDNSGVDYRRLAIAIVYDITHHTSTLGGSTITQQVVKNDVLESEHHQLRQRRIRRGGGGRDLFPGPRGRPHVGAGQLSRGTAPGAQRLQRLRVAGPAGGGQGAMGPGA
ncbi:MAG: hypothetical protein E6J46_14800 [Chloroflexi bacterium]|nr:MAG: hypothetical protein E6J46_14800 [Chloroflexota bacterium]